MIWMSNPFPFQNLHYRHAENSEIEPEALMIDVPQVQCKASVPRGGVAAVYLRPSRNAGKNFMSPPLFWSVAIQILHQQRTRTNEAHLSTKNIPQLRKLVQARPSQEVAEWCDALSIRRGTARATLPHGAEFIECEWTTSETRTFLAKYQRTSQKESDTNRNRDEKWREQNESRRCRDHIKAPLSD